MRGLGPTATMSDQAARTRLVCLGLAAAVCLVYAYTLRCNFIGLDDWPYVVQNTHIQAGAWFERVAWAFTAFHSSNWHPLTWLSHSLDYALFGLNPAGHHLVNVLLHAANTVILFLALARLSGAFWKSAAAAALFGLHPLQVESVAWVASRKGLLAAFFGFLALLAYERYARRPGPRTWRPIVVCLALSLLSKQIFVTLPVLLLLLDWWPLQRLGPAVRPLPALLVEKLPFLALAALASWLTVLAQRHGGAVAPLGEWGLAQRLAYGLAGYAGYLGKTVFPSDLAVFYPLSQTIPWAAAVAGAGLLVGGAALVWRARRSAPYLATGWLWFFVALLPVAGFVQIGSQAMADRYMYVPLVGLAIILCWGIPDLVRTLRYRAALLAGVFVFTASLLSVATWRQTQWWQDAVTLYGRTLEATGDNYFIEHFMGVEMNERRDLAAAEKHFRAALRINPRHYRSWSELGLLLFNAKRYAEAAPLYETAATRWPDDYEIRYNLGASYAHLGRLSDALAQFEGILARKPDDVDAKRNVQILRQKMERAAAKAAPAASQSGTQQRGEAP